MTAPTPDFAVAPSTQGHVSALARNWAVQVDTNYGGPDGDTASWDDDEAGFVASFLLGLTKIGPTNTPGLVDDSDVNSGGWDSQVATTQAGQIVLEGIYKGPRNTGKLKLPPAILYMKKRGMGIGYDNFVHLRYWRTDDIDVAYEIYGPVNWTDGTEDRRGLYIYTSNVTFSGEPLEIEKPTGDVTP